MLFRSQVPYRGPQVPVFWTPQALATLRFEQEQRAANEANLARYNQAMSELQGLRNSDMGDVAQLGRTAKADMRDQYRQQQANIRAGLVARGLNNSTVLPTMLSGASRDYGRQMTALGESLARQRIGVRQADTSRIVNLIASRNDQGPNPALLANTMSQMGAGGIGVPGGMGGPPVVNPLQDYWNQMAIWRQNAMAYAGIGQDMPNPNARPWWVAPRQRQPQPVAPARPRQQFIGGQAAWQAMAPRVGPVDFAGWGWGG